MISPYPRIHGEGRRRPHTLFAVGEAGGEQENLALRPFIGRSGELLDIYLTKNLLPRHRFFITNVYPYWTGPGNPSPTAKQLAHGSRYLLRDLEALRPRYILALGRFAAEFFYGKPLTMEVAHGLPFLYRPDHWDEPAVVVPAYHPTAALRDPETSGKCFYDIRQFSLIVRGLLHPVTPKDVAPNPQYHRLLSYAPASGFFPAVDTEGFPDDPYCVSISTKDGQAYVIPADMIPKGTRLRWGMDKITLHNSMFDLGVLRAMGFEVGPEDFDDTILMARLLLLEPPGLKDLALRHCGMAMREYNEVVGPYYRRAVVAYLRKAGEHDWGKPDAQAVRDKKTNKWRTYQPQPVGNRLKAIIRDLDAGKKIKLEDRWKKIAPSLRAPIEKKLGSFPRNHPKLAPWEELIHYAGRDADATRRIKPRLQALLTAAKLDHAYATDLGSIPMFERMARNGMQINPEHFSAIRPAIVEEIAATGKSWCARYNRSTHLNLASGDQVAQYLFGSLGLRPIKRTRGGTRPSVKEKVLELLKDQHPSISGILAWKKLHTNLTFVDRIPKWMDPATHRIYPNINTQGTVTGRPSTSDPNLLNVPVRSELGKQIRMGFVAPHLHRLVSVDLGQIELRIGAHLSGDKEMIRAFHANEDLHQKTATLLGIDRYIAKTINFGIFYGMSFKRLRSELLEAGIDKSESECAGIIREWFRVFSGVKQWLADLLSGARRRGYVRGLSGRLRYLPNLYLRDGHPLRAEAERHAGNFPVQEGAGYVIKRAMRRMHKWMLANPEARVEPILQIYDELLFEVPKKHAKAHAETLRTMMLSDEKYFRVPLKADVAIGKRWGEL